MKTETMESLLYGIRGDLASVKTDVTWLKRLFTGTIVLIGAIFGVNTTGAF